MDMTLSPITAAILAGGAATRLGGRDKGLEPLGGRPLVAWVIAALAEMDAFKPSPSRGEEARLRATGSRVDERPQQERRAGLLGEDGKSELSNVGGDGVRSGEKPIAAEAAPTIGRADVLIVANRHLDDYSHYARTISDDITGFHGPLAGVAAALSTSETDWLLTVPVDCPEPPRDLVVRLRGGALECSANCVIVHDGERRQPLFALYRRELAVSAADGVAAGWGVWQWQESIGARELDFSDRRRQFENLNTPEDFTAYAKLRLAR